MFSPELECPGIIFEDSVVVSGVMDRYVLGSALGVQCADTFERISGDDRLVCTGEGVWEGEQLLCKSKILLLLTNQPKADSYFGVLLYHK